MSDKPVVVMKKDAERMKQLRERSVDHKNSATKATKENRDAGLRGKVSCDKLPYRSFVPGATTVWPNREGYMNVNVCSSSKTHKGLSPMILGPIEHQDDHTDGVIQVTNLENLWQARHVIQRS